MITQPPVQYAGKHNSYYRNLASHYFGERGEGTAII